MVLAPGDVVTGLAGVYRIETRHGQGSFGVTYRARDVPGGTPVIIKELRIERLDDWKALELFEREGRTLAALSHPNIPAFRDFFAHGAPTPLPVSAMSSYSGPGALSLVLVQQFVEGVTLQQRLDAGMRMPVRDAEGVVRSLLTALHHLHDRTPPLVHRDVKPSNVIVTPEGHPYLVDFGAVQTRFATAGTVGSTIVGTLGYMPLEQTRGDARPASDIYALGVTMVVALTGRPLTEIPYDDASGKIAVRRAIPHDVPGHLRDLLDAMVEPLLGPRIQSAAEALVRLDAHALASRPRSAESRAPAASAVISATDEADLREFETKLGAHGFWATIGRAGRTGRVERKPKTLGDLDVLFYLKIGLPILLPIAMCVHSTKSIPDTARAIFANEFTCSIQRVEARERGELHKSDLEPNVGDDGSEIVELHGCGHQALYACRRGKGNVACKKEPYPVGSSAR